MKVACVYIPDFAVALARRDNAALRGRPVVVGGAPEEHAQVRACSAEAREVGVMEGMTLRRALALCPGAAFLPWRASLVEAEAEHLLETLEGLCPAIEAVDAGHLHCDVQGMERLTACSAEEYLGRIAAGVQEAAGVAALVGGAETVFTAHAAALAGARPGAPMLVEQTLARDFLGGLPVEVLPVTAEMHQRLRLFGLEQLDSVSRVPFNAMQAQFGRNGRRAWELAQGQDDARIVPHRDIPTVTEELELPAPTPLLEPIVVGTRTLVERALSRPEGRGFLWRRLDWWAVLESGETVGRRVVFREPTSDPVQMLFVLRSRLEHLRLTAAAASLRVMLSGLCSEYGRQAPLWATGPKRQRELEAAIEQLNTRVDGPQVFRIVEVQPWSRIPERQLALAPFGR